MIITQEQFDKKMKEKSLRIALIGMSNIGKSFRSKQLKEEKEFEMLCVDESIEKKLGLDGIKGVARWMGHPHQPGHSFKEKEYLKAEDEVMRNVKTPKSKNFVVDSTGSLIYLASDILIRFKNDYLVVHLDVVDEMIQKMTEKFFARPKPVVWGGMFNRNPKEATEVAYRRCYPEWLKFRLEKYRTLADVAVSGEVSANQGMTCDEFLEELRIKLPTE